MPSRKPFRGYGSTKFQEERDHLGGDHVRFLEAHDDERDDDISADNIQSIFADSGWFRIASQRVQLFELCNNGGVLIRFGIMRLQVIEKTVDRLVKIRFLFRLLLEVHRFPFVGSFNYV
jgi:hypothetical protein